MSKLDAIVASMKDVGKSKLQIDRADPNLIAEAIVRGAKHRSWSDAQCVGSFHHYTLVVDGVEVELITTQPVDEKEAKAAAYAGLTIQDYRRMRRGE